MDSPHPQPDDTQRLLDDYTDKPAPTPLTFEPPPPSGSTFAVARNVIFNIRHRLFWASHRVRGLRLYAIGLVALIACMTIQFEPFAPQVPPSEEPKTSDFNTVIRTSFPSSVSVADGRVLVTGGAGSIGKGLIRKLLETATPVTLLDVNILDDEIQEIRDEFPVASRLLHVAQGDVRDHEVVRKAMTHDVVGVVHLAAIARKGWCRESEAACLDIAERGTQTVLAALSDLGARDSKARWFVLGSSTDVYRNVSDVAHAGFSAASALGTSKLKAENVIRHHIDNLATRKAPGALHAVSLRMSTVYGSVFDHVDRMVPSIVTQALNHQVIQVVGGRQKFDMLHIDDAVEGVMRAIHSLTKRRNTWSLAVTGRQSALAVFDLVSGNLATVEELVDKVIRLTRSHSPLRYLPTDNLFPDVNHGRTRNILQELGSWRPMSVDEGLLQLIRQYLKRTERLLKQRYDSSCGQTSPSLVYNEDIAKLNDCHVSVAVDLAGELKIIKMAQNDEHWETSPEVPFSQQRMQSFVRVRENGRPILTLRADYGDRWLGLNTTAVTEDGPFEFAILSSEDIKDGKLVEWEMDVNKEDSTVRLTLAGTPYQLIGPPSPDANYSLVSKDRDIYPFRITPICCELTEAPWPFFVDDPNDFMVEFQKTSVKRLFLGSAPKALCSRFKRARQRALEELATMSLERLEEPRPRTSTRPAEWSQADLPPCSNLCDLPMVCVNTGDCQCVLPICPARDRFPFRDTLSLEFHEKTAEPFVPGSTRLTWLMEQTSWKDVLRPQGRQFVTLGNPAKVHLGPLMPSERDYRANSGIDKLKDGACYSADTSLEVAVDLMKVTEAEADMTFVSLYQHRWWSERFPENYEYVRSQTWNFDPTKVVVPFTHDWGQCFEFEWVVWTMRVREGLKVNPYVRSTTAWTVMADLNSRCYRAHQDVVIPPRTCISPQLFAAFGDVSKVRPIRDRHVFSSFKANLWGTGIVSRQKVLCPRPPVSKYAGLPSTKFKSERELITLYGHFGEYGTYLDVIGDSIFCPQPTGTTGWATRIIDSIYGGCIPVFIGATTEYPFFDMIDWGKISVRVETRDTNRLEQVLMERYTMEDVERMQANLMLVRDAFVYPLDDVTDEKRMEMMWERRGPLWFALYNTGMRLATQWPMSDGWVEP